jgi:hypothetical protein
MVKAFFLAIANGPVGEQRSITSLAGVQHLFVSRDVEEGLLLASETGLRQVLRSGAAPHRHCDTIGVVLPTQFTITISDCFSDLLRKVGIRY